MKQAVKISRSVCVVSLGFLLNGCDLQVHARDQKSDFLNNAKTGVSLERDLVQATEKEVKSERETSVSPSVTGVRLVDLGGNRGARGLAASDDMLGKGSIYDQLQKYGGEAPVVKEDNSLKNPFVYKSGIEAQLKLYQGLQGK